VKSRPIPEERLEAAKKSYRVTTTGDLVFTKVIEVPNTDQSTLYRRAEEFLTHVYPSAKAVIDSRSLQEGYIVGRGQFSVSQVMLGQVSETFASYVIKLEAKENKVRMIINLPNRGLRYPFTRPDKRPDFEDHWYGRAFYYSHLGTMDLAAALDHALKNGNSEEPADW
jgi:hypothetical protein